MLLSLRITEIPGGRRRLWPADRVPPEHLWAFDHIVEHDCRCILCGKTLYEVLRVIPDGCEVPAGVNFIKESEAL